MTEALEKTKRLSGGAILAILIVGAVVVIGPLAFLAALIGSGAESRTTLNGVPVEPEPGALDYLFGLVLLIFATVAEAFALAGGLFLICPAEDRARSPFLLILLRFLVAISIFVGILLAASLVLPEFADAMIVFFGLLVVGAVVARTVSGSRWKKLGYTVLVCIMAAVAWVPIIFVIAVLGLTAWGPYG